MKKTLLILGVMAIGVSAFAQQGSKWLGGALSFNSDEDAAGLKSSGFSISPRFGYYLNDKWAIGIGLGYSTSSVENSATSETTTSGIGIVPFIRCNCVEAGKFVFFGQAELGYTSYESEFTTQVGPANVSTKTDYSATGLSINPGVAYNINESFAVELIMPNIFDYYSYSGDRDGSGMSFAFNSGYSIQNYFLNPTFSFVYKF